MMIRPIVLSLAGCGLLFLSTGAPLAQRSEPLASPPVVTVLDAGAEPRSELRYRFDSGDSDSAAIEMDIKLNMSMAGLQARPVAFPTIRMLVELDAVETLDDGSGRYDFAISSAEIVDNADTDPTLATTLRASLGQLPSVSGWARIDSKGAMLEGNMNLPAGVDPQLNQVFDSAEQSLQQMSAPLPSEPVGVGAVWQVVQSIESAGFSVSQTANYTLTSRNGDEITLDIELTQSGSDQAVELAGLPPGIEANLDALESAGTGSMRIDLNRFVPESESSVDMAVAMSVALQGQTQPIGLNMQTMMKIAPLD
jgi:hypothetical protein